MNTEALIEKMRSTIELYKKQFADQKPLFEAKQITYQMMITNQARIDGRIQGMREAIRQIQATANNLTLEESLANL